MSTGNYCHNPLRIGLDSLSDNALVLRVQAADVDRMGLLFGRCRRRLFGFRYHPLGQAEASEDLVQNVFYRLLKYRHTFTGDGEFRTWMYHLARNVLADYVKKNHHAAHHTDVADLAEHLGGGSPADAGLEQAQDVVLLHQALAQRRTR